MPSLSWISLKNIGDSNTYYIHSDTVFWFTFLFANIATDIINGYT